MNIGSGYLAAESGELWVLDFFNKEMTKLNQRPVIIFDVGAHDGTYAYYVLKKMGNQVKLFCAEPSKATFESLQKRLEVSDNVKVLNFGFGEREELVTLYSNGAGSPMSSLYPRNLSHAQQISDFNSAEEIHLRTLDNFCLEEGIERIDFLKLDVEGHELKVLKGALNLLHSNSICFIQFEFGESNIDSRTYFQDYFYLLNPYYKTYRILRSGLELIEQYSYNHEVFRVMNYLAVSRKIESN